MGGMEAGEVASQTALRTVLQAATAAAAERLPPAEPPSGAATGADQPRLLNPVDLVYLAAPAVYAAAAGRQVGTTLTCVLVQDGELTLGHVGDTRAYLLRGERLSQLTVDHSLVASMVASGVLTPEEARGHPDSNKVLRSLGGRRELPERYVDDLAAAYGQPSLRLEPGDWLLLCSDGVWGSVEDERISATLRQAADCPAAVRSLLEQALRAGAPDNAAAVVARCAALPTV
jgi:protein phosphatase